MKLRIYTSLALLSTLLTIKGQSFKVEYSDDLPFTLNLSKESLKIVQFTDLHLTYGFDEFDKLTYTLIDNVIKETTPDLIVFTGDQTLSVTAPLIYKLFVKFMEEYNIPWTFVFGNHDNDFHKYNNLLGAIDFEESKNLLFKVGPQLYRGGVGNFALNYYYEGTPFYNLYFLDSKTEQRSLRRVGVSKYDHFSPAQVGWFQNKVLVDKTNNVKSSVFTHVPLIQHRLAMEKEYASFVKGHRGEGVYSQNIDTGFFDAMVESGVSEAIFVGHDHKNSFVFTHEGIKLTYGRISGYNGYGNLKRGARIIEIDETRTLSTYLIYEDLSYEY